MKMKCLLLLALLWLSTVSVPALDWWIEPMPSFPRPGQDVDLRWMEGSDFRAEELAFDGERFALFQTIWRAGRSNLRGTPGQKPAGRFRAGEAGVYLVSFSSEAESGAGPGQREYRFGKALVVVGQARAGDPVRWSELGQRLELVPQSDPVPLARSGGKLEVQLLFEREPLSDVVVTAMPQSAPGQGRQQATTDEIGLATFNLDRPGTWIIRAEHGRIRENLTTTLVLSVQRGG